MVDDDPEQQAARTILGPYHRDLAEIVYGAWSDYTNTHLTYPVSARTRANIVWDYMVRRADERFAGDSRITVAYQGQTVWFVLDQRWLLRFKKGDHDGLSNNIQTQQALHWYDPQMAFDGMQLTTLEVVYTLDRWQASIEQVQIVARSHDSVRWAYPLEGVTGDGVKQFQPPERQHAAEQKAEAQEQPAGPRWRAKNGVGYAQSTSGDTDEDGTGQ